MSKVTQEHSESLMGIVKGNGTLAQHGTCVKTIRRLTRERDEATTQRDNLRAALIAAVGLERVCEIEGWGFQAEKQRREKMKSEAA